MSDLMSDELEELRKKKIEGFHLDFDADNEFGDYEVSSTTEVKTQPEAEDSGIDLESGRIDGDSEELSSGDESEELLSYSQEPAENEDVVLNKKELRAAKKKDKKRRKYKAQKNRVIFRTVWFAMIVFVSIMIGEYLLVGVNDVFAIGRETEKSVTVTIPKDVTLEQMTDILLENGIIKNENFFKLVATLTKATSGFTQGTFEVPTNKDYLALINYLQSDQNRTDVVRIMFSEGLTVLEYADNLERKNVCTAEEFLKACNSDEFDEDYEFLKDIKNKSKRYYKLEGYLFPDTYDFYVGEDVSSVVRKFLSNYRYRLYRTKERFVKHEKKQTYAERAETVGMTMEEVIKMASLIQAEAANKDDMYIISSVLHNRLATIENGGENENGEGGLGYLQLDSTVFYPYHTEENVPASIRKNYVSKYSTYKYQGLPEGSICNPGLEAIKAALNPEDTSYYYFCHKAATDNEPAVPYYAETNYQHLQNQEEAGLL